ncbi:MAG: hypothetical protein J5842_01225 [Lachnospiraceae bacterium]|nr:hypothetical protein [Lachnospiraceae bacterium]
MSYSLYKYRQERRRNVFRWVVIILVLSFLSGFVVKNFFPLWEAKKAYKSEYKRYTKAYELANTYNADNMTDVRMLEKKKYPFIVWRKADREKVITLINSDIDSIKNEAAKLFMSAGQAAADLPQPQIPEAEEETTDIQTEAEGLSGNTVSDNTQSEDETSMSGATEEDTGSDDILIDPDEEFILSRLEKVKRITSFMPATEDNDPNGRLHREDGYKSAVFFSTAYFDPSDIRGETIVDKGTEAGGVIEVYATQELAMDRAYYLSYYDETVWANGTHAVIGSIVIRLSDRLTEWQQRELEAGIIKALREE